MDSETAKKWKEKYFTLINSRLEHAYKVVERALSKGYDREHKVDIPVARDMADRVEGLISSVAPQLIGKGLPERIKELEGQYGLLDWRVALITAEEVSKEKFCKFKDLKEAMEVGIRAGFLYNTLGIVAAPLEGFIGLEIKQRRDGKEYIAIRYAGPIRGAGGTASSVSVLISDYVRLKHGYAPYDPDEKEVNRLVTEIFDYNDRVTNLQYKPSEEELKFLIQHIPIEISGDPTERLEVSNYKDCDRMDTNQIRGGICLVLAEGVSQKCNKLWKRLGKWGDEMGLEWGWMKEFIDIQKKVKAKNAVGSEEGDKPKITPNYTFITDVVAGRPVYTYPLRDHGFRLRYGRGRNTGFSASAVHPHTMACLHDFVALGTQFKIERPGKAASILTCDSIEAPIVRLKNGDVIKFDNSFSDSEVRKYTSDIEEIIFMGDMLFNYGDFSENGHNLVPAGYCPEWWVQEFEKAISEKGLENVAEIIGCEKEFLTKIFRDPLYIEPSPELSLAISKEFNIPLHPNHTFYWKLAEKEEFIEILNGLKKAKIHKEGEKLHKIVFYETEKLKQALENVGVPHINASNEYLVVEGKYAEAFLINLGIDDVDNMDYLVQKFETVDGNNALDMINQSNSIIIRDKAGTFIGSRMGRPEKAKMRKLTGSPHILFPVGEEGGRLRSFQSAMENGIVKNDFPIYICPNCNAETIFTVCETCESKTVKKAYCSFCDKVVDEEGCEYHGTEFLKTYRNKEINVNGLFNYALKKLDTKVYPDLIKGVKGTMNKDHIPEHIIKGILRAKHEVYVNKDGTVRYDFSEEPITHFKPCEISTSVEKLKEMGYEQDIDGQPIKNDDQIIEIFPQDIIINNKRGMEDACSTVMLKVSQFIDELLVKLYEEPPYYNFKKESDIVGAFVIGLAPHISAGMMGRIIGFTDAQACISSPLWHAALRRDCDGDECCIMLLMDALLNFSRQYLPDRRGGRTMDAPLVLTSELNPAEVDDQALGVDIVWRYPLEMYEAALEYKKSGEVEIEQIAERLGGDFEFFGYGFTHDTDSINKGVIVSAYKSLPSMYEKLEKQMHIAKIIRAVDTGDVARLIIDRHFLKDTKGNLRKFSMQQMRCVKCNEKYRRPPLKGVCEACGGKLVFTISESSVIKYLQHSINLSNEYNVPPYICQTLDILKRRVEGVFGKEKEKQAGLNQFFS